MTGYRLPEVVPCLLYALAHPSEVFPEIISCRRQRPTREVPKRYHVEPHHIEVPFLDSHPPVHPHIVSVVHLVYDFKAEDEYRQDTHENENFPSQSEVQWSPHHLAVFLLDQGRTGFFHLTLLPCFFKVT